MLERYLLTKNLVDLNDKDLRDGLFVYLLINITRFNLTGAL